MRRNSVNSASGLKTALTIVSADHDDNTSVELVTTRSSPEFYSHNLSITFPVLLIIGSDSLT